MNTIALIAVFDEIIDRIKDKIEIISAKNIVGLDFIIGKMGGNSVVLVRSGKGKVNIAVCSQILIDMYAVDYIINAGAAEIISPELSKGDIAVSSETCYYDLDMENVKGEESEICLFLADTEIIGLLEDTCAKSEKKAVVGRFAAGDAGMERFFEKSYIKSKLKAICADGESGAVGQVCGLNKIPFASVNIAMDNVSKTLSETVSDSEIDVFTEIISKVLTEI